MNIDDQFKAWREATASVAPSAGLMASLEAQVTGAGPASGVTVPTVSAAKILLVGAVVVGLAAVYFPRPRTVEGTHLGMPMMEMGVPRGGVPTAMPSAAVPSVVAQSSSVGLNRFGCPVDGGPPVVRPSGGLSAGPTDRARVEAQQRAESSAFSCPDHGSPFFVLARGAAPAEQAKWQARSLYLCGTLAIEPPRVSTTPCDPGDWCLQPAGCLGSEPCAETLAHLPEGGCLSEAAHRTLVYFACSRLLRGEGTEAAVRKLSNEAWCLDPAALAERDWLISHGAKKGSVNP